MQFSDDDLADIVGDSNGPAYRRLEERNGPPLDYVAGKAESALLAAHEVLRSIERYVPDELPQPEEFRGTAFSAKEDGLLSPAWTAFRYGLISYLALQNMLSLAGESEIVDRLSAMSSAEFRGWLHGVTSEGSVTGE
jgi:hypothetical protein